MPARTYAVLNRKGGVGKTSLCFHLGGELARRGLCVLLIDLDPQRNLTDKLLMDPETGEVPEVPYEDTVAALFDPDVYQDHPSNLVRSATRHRRVSLLPGSHRMEHLNRGDPAQDHRQLVVRDFIDSVSDRYEVVLIDCPPNTMIASWAAMAAADGVLVPIVPEDWGAAGLRLLNESMARVRQEINPGLRASALVLNMFNQRLRLHRNYAQLIRESLPDQVLETAVPASRDLKMAVTMGTPITLFRHRSKASQVIQELCDELMARDEALVGPGGPCVRQVGRGGPCMRQREMV